MDTARTVHIASEVVILGGVIFYFNNQIKTLKTEIKELKTKLEEDSQSNNKHLQNLYSLVDKINIDVKQLASRPPPQQYIPPPQQVTQNQRAPTPAPIPATAPMALRKRNVTVSPLPNIEEEDAFVPPSPQKRQSKIWIKNWETS